MSLRHLRRKNIVYKPLYYSLSAFQFFYGSFLICTEGYVPSWLHTTTVVLFGISYIIHAGMILKYVEPCKLACANLVVGIASFISLLFVKDMWFWAMESVGFTSLLLFTPIEWYHIRDKDICSHENLYEETTTTITKVGLINLNI